MSLEKKEVSAQDMAISLGSITEFTDSSLFDIKMGGFQPVD